MLDHDVITGQNQSISKPGTVHFEEAICIQNMFLQTSILKWLLCSSLPVIHNLHGIGLQLEPRDEDRVTQCLNCTYATK